MKHVLYGDTDSIFIDIPLSKEERTTQDLIEIANETSEEINDRIKFVVESFMLPALGCDIAHNQTFFKTELVADAIMFLDIKKNYAYRELADMGVIHSEPKFKYKGIPVVKSNVAPLSKKLIRLLVESVALDKDIIGISMSNSAVKIKLSICEEVKQCIMSGSFDQFGTPCKWGSREYAREPAPILGMRLYNTLTKSETFTPNSGGMYFPIKFNDSSLTTKIKDIKRDDNMLSNIVGMSQVKFLTVPYDYDPETLLKVLSHYGITLDIKDVFTSIVSKVTDRIVDAINKVALNG